MLYLDDSHLRSFEYLYFVCYIDAEKPFDEWRQQIECIREDSRTMLTNYQHKCDEKNIDSLKVQDERYTPGPTICKVAKENEVALIVLGSRGLTKMRRTILGSVSDYVVHHSHLPVCVVCDEESNPPNRKDPVLRQNTAPPKLRNSWSSISDGNSHQEDSSS
ncbi:uncharacterized protein LOC110251703 [Exaiptasia diaphana]|uniref:UspA domain-containing protein n=1 Tax=Exaiptasia diaphana TaxID=2652724 RepID=A0A913Y394_EXADI|nr:uncharacterized protein LOC110251703 [Exaiptasia diaphana]KXJ07050.1 Universal stress protein Slr1101 [Exaiptasia diaphana]